jgi:catechol 2,3-dioxygenase
MTGPAFIEDLGPGVVPVQLSPNPIPPDTMLRHVGLKTADLDRVREYYVDVLGFHVTLEIDGAIFLSATGYHHDLAFFAWESRGGPPPPPNATGLDHIAILYRTRDGLADACRRLHGAGQWPPYMALDFGTHHGVFVRDPDGNPIELHWDKPVEDWVTDDEGHWIEVAAPIDVDELLAYPGDAVSGHEESR